MGCQHWTISQKKKNDAKTLEKLQKVCLEFGYDERTNGQFIGLMYFKDDKK